MLNNDVHSRFLSYFVHCTFFVDLSNAEMFFKI